MLAALGSPVVPEVYMYSALFSMLGGRFSCSLSAASDFASISRSRRGHELGWLPCIQILGGRKTAGRAATSWPANSEATMRCLGETTLMQWAREAPVRFTFRRETTPPTLLIPSHIARYSGRFVISRPTTSP